jgi:hypothetical protein
MEALSVKATFFPRIIARLAPAIVALALAALCGCVTNDDSSMPWAAPAPGEGNIPLPSSFLRE